MATQFSDIYIDGVTTEELHADGGQIVEAWLDGECIWRLISTLANAKHVIIWIRHNETYYGLGQYLLSDKSPYTNWQRIFFKGKNISNMAFNYVDVSNGINDIFYNNFTTDTPVSLYDFGYCIFPQKATGINTVSLPKIIILPNANIYNTDVSKSVKFQDVLEKEYVNISDPLGVYCSVFNKKYQIRGSNHYETSGYQRIYGFIEVYDMDNNTIRYVPPDGDASENRVICRTSMCAKMGSRIFFPATYSATNYIYEDISLLYIEEPYFQVVKKLKIEISAYTETGHGLSGATAGAIGTDGNRIVFLLQLLFRNYSSNEYQNKFILAEYKNGVVLTAQLALPETFVSNISVENNSSIKVTENFIVAYLFNPYGGNVAFFAGKSISKMNFFQLKSTGGNNHAQPHIFYEENGELFYDEIYTYNTTSYVEPVSSVIRKNRVDFETGNIVMVSETEINGRLEE